MPAGKMNQEPVVLQEPAVLHAIKGKVRETILELDVDGINSESGVENSINCLDNLYLKA